MPVPPTVLEELAENDLPDLNDGASFDDANDDEETSENSADTEESLNLPQPESLGSPEVSVMLPKFHYSFETRMLAAGLLNPTRMKNAVSATSQALTYRELAGEILGLSGVIGRKVTDAVDVGTPEDVRELSDSIGWLDDNMAIIQVLYQPWWN